MTRPEQGVTLRRIWQAWCSRCGWRSDHPTKGEAGYVLGAHMIDRHGGTPRIGSSDD